MKKKMSILAALVLAVIVTGYSVSGTYAKYTSTFTGKTSTATIAKWAIEMKETADGTYAAAADDFKFNLFETITETDGSIDTDVKNDGTKNTVIAPGTKGTFTIYLKNASDVNAAYDVEFTPNINGLPINFTVNGVTGLNNISAKPINMNGEETVKVDWEWPFNATGDDTSFASTSTDSKTVTVAAKIIVNQVD